MNVNNVHMNKCQYFMSVSWKIFNIFIAKYIVIVFNIKINKK
jgi:hypothetical protein